jgi:hypothetical protein
MLPTDRIAYSAITERAPLKLPDGARMAVWVIVNVEEWNPLRAYHGSPNVAIRSMPHTNSTRFSSIFGSRRA